MVRTSMDQARQITDALPPPIVVPCEGEDFDELLSREWLHSNRIGAYASSTVLGCNTRRYHGLLVAASNPPVGRFNALTSVMEQFTDEQSTYQLATNEFPDAICPRGLDHLEEFQNDVAPTFVFGLGDKKLTKRIVLAERSNTVAIQYQLHGGSGVLRLRPFAAMRDFHHLRHASRTQQITFVVTDGTVIVQDLSGAEHVLYLSTQDGEFQCDPQWWYKFAYRVELARGQDGLEDIYSPGIFTLELQDGQAVQFNASLDENISVGFETTVRSRRARLSELASAVNNGADQTTRRLAAATDSFVVLRVLPSAAPSAPSATILAGYHWFADWGRDAFIALPGLLLITGKFDLARAVFTTFAEHIADGMIPNRFDDRSSAAHYNSIDASLWFIIAADRYLQATGDVTFWRDQLAPAARAILGSYEAGTRFDIRADADGLLTGGSPETQLTWMDAKIGKDVVTPRHGKPVEVNALWCSAHAIMADRCKGIDETACQHYTEQTHLIAAAFVKAFWNPQCNCLYDCITEGEPDASIRPNQIFAVSLPHSPLTVDQQRGVLSVVTEHLLTPFGLRSLSPTDGRYRGRYEGSPESRDRAYHQGTVWAWLLGAYVEAYLKLEGDNRPAVEHARELIAAFEGHMSQAGLGQISEIFDGDGPHKPRGCIAQGWSVAEILRARCLIAKFEERLGT